MPFPFDRPFRVRFDDIATACSLAYLVASIGVIAWMLAK